MLASSQYALAQRLNITISRQQTYCVADGVTLAGSPDEALAQAHGHTRHGNQRVTQGFRMSKAAK